MDDVYARLVKAMAKIGLAPVLVSDLAETYVVLGNRKVVVVKPLRDWQAGIGEVLHRTAGLALAPVLVLAFDAQFGDVNDPLDFAHRVGGKNTPEIEVWAFDTDAAALDMGCGRNIEV